MHMRRKPWARPELAACGYYREEPAQLRGRWGDEFARRQPLQVELGCGKGVSTARMALENPGVNFVAVDVGRDVLGCARRNAQAAYGDAPVDNLILAALNVEQIGQYFAAQDAVERIYISFCNPWTLKKRHEKRRLTHPRQLWQYRSFLMDGGELHFKTDDDALFDDTLGYLSSCGFEVRYLTRDLHRSGYAPNYESEHELKYAAQGVPVKFLIAVKRPDALLPAGRLVRVAAAVIENARGEVLLCRRGPGGDCAGRWEFPGGKLEPGEDAQACARREVLEELGVRIRPVQTLGETVYAYPSRTVALTFVRAALEEGGPLELREHAQMAWVRPRALTDYALCPADVQMARALAARDAP